MSHRTLSPHCSTSTTTPSRQRTLSHPSSSPQGASRCSSSRPCPLQQLQQQPTCPCSSCSSLRALSRRCKQQPSLGVPALQASVSPSEPPGCQPASAAGTAWPYKACLMHAPAVKLSSSQVDGPGASEKKRYATKASPGCSGKVYGAMQKQQDT